LRPIGEGVIKRGAQLAGLWALAVAQPFFDVTDSGEAFVLAGWRGGDVALLALGVTFAPPALMLAIEAVAGRVSGRAAGTVHVAFVAAIVAILAAYAVKDGTDVGGEAASAIAVAAALLGGWLFVRSDAVRAFCTVLGPASLLFVGLFLLASPVRHLVIPSEGSDLAGPRPAAPVVMIVFDEFPTLSLLDGGAELDEAAYPAFARIARDGIWYRNATTVSDHTTTAVPSILTGRHEDGDRPASFSAHPDNILALLGRRGGARAIESLTRLCPRDVCADNAPEGLPGRITRPLPALGKLSLATFLPDDLYRRLPGTDPLPLATPERSFERFEAGLGSRAAVHYVHVQLPHQPWVRAASGRRLGGFGTDPFDFLPHLPRVALKTGLPTLGEVRWTQDPRRVTHMLQRHLLQVRAADRRLGQLLARLRDAGLDDDALIVVTADHGVAFEPGADARRLERETAPGILHVPLFVKFPAGRGGGTVDDRFVQTIDIAPTIAQGLGLRLPWRTDGRSALTAAPDRARLVTHAIGTDREMTFNARELAQRLRDGAAGQAGLFHGSGPARIFRTGPNGALVGRPLAGLPRAGSSPLRHRLAGPAEALRFDPRSNVVPVVMSGFVIGPRASGRELAVVLNGRVAATVQTHPSAAEPRFEAIVDERLVRPGPNRLELYEIAPGPRLAPIPLASP
jgi:hypothetical protein